MSNVVSVAGIWAVLCIFPVVNDKLLINCSIWSSWKSPFKMMDLMPAAVWVRLLSSLENRCVKDRCFWSVLSTNAASNQMAPICLKRWGPEANRTTQTHYNRPFLGTLHVRTIMQMPRGSCQLSLQRTGGDHENALALHGWAPYSRIWDAIISHCLKQWIWPRTSLLGGCGRCMALRSLELHARNDDGDNDVHTSLEAQLLPCCRKGLHYNGFIQTLKRGSVWH